MMIVLYTDFNGIDVSAISPVFIIVKKFVLYNILTLQKRVFTAHLKQVIALYKN